MLSTHPFVPPYEQPDLRLEKSTSPAYTNSFVRRVKQLIRSNFDNELFDVNELARQAHLSVSQLNRKLNKHLHQSAGQLIWEMKMDYATQLLSQDEAAIGEVAYEVGYKNQAHFCRSFKRRFACTPSAFKARKSD